MEPINDILECAVNQHASDVHLTVGVPPVYRIAGQLRRGTGEPLQAQEMESMVKNLLTTKQWDHLVTHGEIDFSYSITTIARFRINAFRQRGRYSIAARFISMDVPSMDGLGLPSCIRNFADQKQGLLLVTGPTGTGKSTTLAAFINHINLSQYRHIITLEDPIEYMHSHMCSIIDQREVGIDTMSFAQGLRAALRQDPDILLVGEMRDLETVAIAITAAETGHLVLATLHTPDAPQSIERMIDVFPAVQHQQIRTQLASVLIGVISQRLIPSITGDERVLATEILVNTPAVANLIRLQKVHQIRSMIQTGSLYGMQTMDMCLHQLVQAGVISQTEIDQLHVLSTKSNM
ncbi:MAG: type IV pilus twitching motility protein PilT [Acidibacillus sp.]|nr:type IV pilus twitching motility protein PilT [Acidibacillus sp.]